MYKLYRDFQNKSKDIAILKDLAKAINKFGFHCSYKNLIYERPFSKKDNYIIDLILEYAEKIENFNIKLGMLYSLGVPGFDDAIPYLCDLFEKYVANTYNEPTDEIYMQQLGNIIFDIKSVKYKELYKKIINSKICPSSAIFIELIDELKISDFDDDILKVIYRENVIPNQWLGSVSETDKYWCSEIALIYILNRKDDKYDYLIEVFKSPEKLEWISFVESSDKQTNYKTCYNRYKKIASNAEKYKSIKKKIKPLIY